MDAMTVDLLKIPNSLTKIQLENWVTFDVFVSKSLNGHTGQRG